MKSRSNLGPRGCALADITWAGRTLSGSDHFGEWSCETPDAWWDSPETKGEDASRPNADGDYDLPIFNQARLPTFNGLLEAVDHDALHEAGNFLTGAMTGRILVSGHGPAQWAEAKRAGKIRFVPKTDTIAQWQVSLKCVDPRKYGGSKDVVLTAPQDMIVSHRGNYGAFPRFLVRGSAPSGYDLWGPGGKRYRVVRPLVSGRAHRVEFSDGLLRVDGVLLPNAAQSDVWAIPPGPGTSIGISTVSGTAEATVTVTDTYI